MAMKPTVFDESSAFFEEMSSALELHPITSERQLDFLLQGIVLSIMSINSYHKTLPLDCLIYHTTNSLEKPYGSQGPQKT